MTGVFMVGTVILCFLLLPLGILSFLIGLITCLSSWEFFKLRFSSEKSIVLSLILFLSLIYISFGIGFQLTLISIAILIWMIMGTLILGFPHNKNILQNNIFWLISGFFIHMSFWTSLFLIGSSDISLLEPIGISLPPPSFCKNEVPLRYFFYAKNILFNQTNRQKLLFLSIKVQYSCSSPKSLW